MRLKSPHGARALYWDGSRWWILLEANIRSAAGGGIFEHFDLDNRQEYTDERLLDALDVLLA